MRDDHFRLGLLLSLQIADLPINSPSIRTLAETTRTNSFIILTLSLFLDLLHSHRKGRN
jgi:hypothetical protein